MSTPTQDVEREVESQIVDSGTLSIITKAEIDQQIATARKFPRSLKLFRESCLEMATLTEKIATECIYALPRGGKIIEGPSARLAEIIASAWGNCRAGARTVAEDGEFVTAQGVFHDLQSNTMITYEVKRRIVDKNGIRFKADMIGVTANAACSIALRNAIMKGVPKAFWSDIYDAARQTSMGDAKTLATRRADAVAYLSRYGVTEQKICKTLGVSGIEDIGLEELAVLKGIATAIKEGDTTPELVFSDQDLQPGQSAATKTLNENLKKGKGEKSAQSATEKPSPDQTEDIQPVKNPDLPPGTKEKEPATATTPTKEAIFAKIENANGHDALDEAALLAMDYLKGKDKKEAEKLIEEKRKALPQSGLPFDQ